MAVDSFSLRSGFAIPSVGFGMYLVPTSVAQQICEEGLSIGYIGPRFREEKMRVIVELNHAFDWFMNHRLTEYHAPVKR